MCAVLVDGGTAVVVPGNTWSYCISMLYDTNYVRRIQFLVAVGVHANVRFDTSMFMSKFAFMRQQ